MLWKYLSLQKFLDALFDEGWCSLGLPEGFAGADAEITEIASHHAVMAPVP